MKGSLIKRGSSWVAVFDLGRGPDGKRKQKWETIGPVAEPGTKGGLTKKKAEAKLTELVDKANKGTYIEPSKITVAEWLEIWLRDYAPSDTTPKTLERYTGIVNGHLIRDLGHHLLSKLDSTTIRAYYTKCKQGGRRDGKPGGLSDQTILHHHRILSSALQAAVDREPPLLLRNPARKKSARVSAPQRKEITTFNYDQLNELLSLARQLYYYLPIALAVYTGMRRGEILALRWVDLDFFNGKVAVRRALEQTAKGIRFKETKTTQSRVVDLPPEIMDALRSHLSEQRAVQERMGNAYQDQGLILAQKNGRPMNPSDLSRSFHDFIRKTGLPIVTFHELRHAHASNLIADGIPVKAVSERLGHSRTSITQDIYSHVLPTTQAEVVSKLNTKLRLVK